IASSGLDTGGLHCQVTDGGSQAMELMILGACGPAGSKERPLLLLDPAYTNYLSFAERLGRATVSVSRTLRDDGTFALPDLAAIEKTIEERRPGALVVIPYDNPTGQFTNQAAMTALARVCVKHGLWMVSDEAYRELHYGGGPASSIWGVSETEAPGVSGRRISIESASKVWNGCGLRIGALVTDSRAFHEKAVAENTAGLCSNAIGQWIFGALAGLPHAELRAWYERLRGYYRDMLLSFAAGMRDALPGVIVSSPDASIYSVVDVRKVVRPGFDALQFVDFCATKGRCDVEGRPMTLLTAPLAGFYKVAPGSPDPGLTQLRVAFVEPPETMRRVPALFAEMVRQFEAQR
ncbi:MAG: aminotransferase class I/II-fold pyridoxal phosphate-dependent enzyme, partial [Planctomycetota bacterium]